MTPRARRWWSQRKPRERLLAVGVLLAALVVIADTSTFAPQRARAAAASKALQTARAQLAELQKLAAQHEQQGDAATRERLTALQTRRAGAEKVIRDAQVDLIPPQQMVQQLANILARHPRLHVVAANSLPPAAVGEAGGARTGAVGVLYQHGMELQVEGRYMDLLAYLEALEAAPQRIYWRELELKVGANGVPLTRVGLYTLSKEPAWLRI
jgi:MSHA biogenesis protein MshJ